MKGDQYEKNYKDCIKCDCCSNIIFSEACHDFKLCDCGAVAVAVDGVNIQGQRNSMHFEAVFDDDYLIGFISYALDLGGIRTWIHNGNVCFT